MKVLVTGATGFIGNHVINKLLINGCTVIASSKSASKAETKKWFSQVKYIEADLNKNKNDWFKFFGSPDCMIHLAWEGLPNFNAHYHFQRNLQTNYCFIENMLMKGLKDVTITGTCLEYGMQYGKLSEDIITKPTTSYGLAKDCLRKFIEQLKKSMDFNFKWIRLFYMYGEGQNKNSLMAQLDKTIENNDKVFNMSEGEQLRDYLTVDEVAENVSLIALQNNVQGIINCCSGSPVSIRNLVEKYIKGKNSSIQLNLGYYPYPDYEPIAFWGDNKKLLKCKGTFL